MSEPTLSERQRLFVKCLGALIQYATQQRYELTLGEGYILEQRKTRSGNVVSDGVHMPGSLHYVRLAQDLNLWVGGMYITDGGHPAWTDLGTYFEGLDPLCRWGGRFRSGDANHVSVTYNGKA